MSHLWSVLPISNSGQMGLSNKAIMTLSDMGAFEVLELDKTWYGRVSMCRIKSVIYDI